MLVSLVWFGFVVGVCVCCFFFVSVGCFVFVAFNVFLCLGFSVVSFLLLSFCCVGLFILVWFLFSITLFLIADPFQLGVENLLGDIPLSQSQPQQLLLPWCVPA